MRGWIALGVSVLVGCSGADAGGSGRLHGGAATDTQSPEVTAAPAATEAPVATPACPTDLPQAVAITQDAVSDLRIVGSTLVYRSGNDIVRVNKDGSGKTILYSSKILVRSFADADGIVAVESAAQNDPVATFKVIPLGTSTAARETDTTFGPTATFVFGSDSSAFYAIGDDDKPAIVAIKKSGGAPQTLATIEGAISFPQIVGSSIWFVVDGHRVERLPVDGSAAPVKVFESAGATSCALAVGDAFAFCSLGTSIEQRALTGSDQKTLLEGDKSKVPGLLGAALSSGDSLFVRSTPDTSASPYGDVLRAVRTTGEEKLLACGRTGIHDVVVDASTIAWAEGQSGAFVAPR